MTQRNKIKNFGHVSRMDNLQAAILNFRLKNLNQVIKKRRENANIYMKHLLSFLILYFLNSSFIVGDKHPTTKLINSIVLYIAFIIIMRQNNIITLILFVLIFVIHLINEYENYYSDIYDKLSNTEDVIEKEEMRDEIERYKKLIINLRNILKIITIITITIAIVGLIVNYHMTRMRGGRFSSLKFILGDVKCATE